MDSLTAIGKAWWFILKAIVKFKLITFWLNKIRIFQLNVLSLNCWSYQIVQLIAKVKIVARLIFLLRTTGKTAWQLRVNSQLRSAFWKIFRIHIFYQNCSVNYGFIISGSSSHFFAVFRSDDRLKVSNLAFFPVGSSVVFDLCQVFVILTVGFLLFLGNPLSFSFHFLCFFFPDVIYHHTNHIFQAFFCLVWVKIILFWVLCFF